MSTPNATASDLAKKMGISVKGVEKPIGYLKKQGIIYRVCPDKGGHWEMISKS